MNEQQSTKGYDDSAREGVLRRRHVLILVLLLSLTLACMTNTIAIRVTHNWKAGDEQRVTMEMEQVMDPVWVEEAQKANEDIRSQCNAQGLDCTPDMFLPEKLSDFDESSAFGSLEMTDLLDQGFTRTDVENGALYARSWTLAEFQDYLVAEDDEESMLVEATTDAGGDTHYVIQFTFGSAEEEESDQFQWEEWDAFMKEKEPPKPPMSLPTAEETPTAEGAEPTTQTGLGSLFGDMGAADMPALTEWYWGHALRETGFPTFYRFVLDVPGDLVSRTYNGETAGEVLKAGGVAFAIDEAFVRENGTQGPWVFRVESVVKKGAKEPKEVEVEKAPTATAVPKQKAAATVAKAATPSVKPDRQRYRIRPLTNRSFGVVLGAVSKTYELQEMDDQGSPTGTARMRFTGLGLSMSLKFVSQKAYESKGPQWAEFTLKKGAMSLADFDGVWGWHIDAGAVSKSWTGALFGSKHSPLKLRGGFQGVGSQLAPYLGADLALGTWHFVPQAE